MSFRHGLVVGKFAPLHRGHEALIGFAQERCERVTVISYSRPAWPRATSADRERWLQLRVPGVQSMVLDERRLTALCRARGLPERALPFDDEPADLHRRFVAWLLQDVLRETVDAVFTSEGYGDGFAAVLSECFRAADARHPAVTHVCMDRERLAVPVSGTAVRADAAAQRAFVSDEVWADLVPRVCVLGGESSGKTTLARALAEALHTVWVPEYGRARCEQLGTGAPSLDELLHIAQTQVEHERALAMRANGWLVCDTSPLTTCLYAELDHGEVPIALHELSHRHYDLVVLCEPDFGFVQDGTRRDAGFRRRQHERTLAWIEARAWPCFLAKGDVAGRVASIIAALEGGLRTHAGER
jgi:HTH-type transcriptional regulator, transcriptional repressor of NAD biosynthesis genes